MTEKNFEVSIYPTPNPNALKFVCSVPVKNVDSSTYRSPMECVSNNLALKLFTIRGVDQLHFFEHAITVTKFGYEEWDAVEPLIKSCLYENLGEHDPSYEDPDPEADRRKGLSPELKKIEEILDRTIRPGLQADGGDIQAISIENNVLLVRYQGACGTCPSSTTGTLEAIRGILKDEHNPEIDVYIAPEW